MIIRSLLIIFLLFKLIVDSNEGISETDGKPLAVHLSLARQTAIQKKEKEIKILKNSKINFNLLIKKIKVVLEKMDEFVKTNIKPQNLPLKVEMEMEKILVDQTKIELVNTLIKEMKKELRTKGVENILEKIGELICDTKELEHIGKQIENNKTIKRETKNFLLKNYNFHSYTVNTFFTKIKIILLILKQLNELKNLDIVVEMNKKNIENFVWNEVISGIDEKHGNGFKVLKEKDEWKILNKKYRKMSELLQLNYFANLFYKLIEWIVSTLSLDIKGILKENEKPKTKEIKSLRSFMKQNSDLNKDTTTPAEKLLFIWTIAENVFKKLEYKNGKFELRDDLEMKEKENELKIFPCWSYEDEKFCLETIETIIKLLKIYENIKELYGLEYFVGGKGKMLMKIKKELKEEMNSEEILPLDLEMYIIEYFGGEHEP